MKTVYTSTDPVTIKNENGTADRSTCSCGSWIAHWEIYSGEKPNICSVEYCTSKGTEGAHVTRPKAKNDDYKTHSYIVPMCKTHNGMHGKSFTTKDKITFVWANVQETCG